MAGRKSEFSSLTALPVNDLRAKQSDARYQVVKEAGGENFSKTVRSFIVEGDRAFREGDSATDDKHRKDWYARATLEYRDALAEVRKEKELVVIVTKSGPGPFSESSTETGESAEKTYAEGSAREQAETEKAKELASNALKSVGGGLSDLILSIAIAYFVTEALKGATVGSLRRA